MKRSTKKTAAAPAPRKKTAPPPVPAAHYVPAEMFDVSKVVRGEGVCEVACAAIEPRRSFRFAHG